MTFGAEIAPNCVGLYTKGLGKYCGRNVLFVGRGFLHFGHLFGF